MPQVHEEADGVINEARRIAAFLDIPIDEMQWTEIFEHCSFDWMKRNVIKSVPLGDAFWDAGAQVFINRGVNGRWAEALTPEDVAAYEAWAVWEFGPDCAQSDSLSRQYRE